MYRGGFYVLLVCSLLVASVVGIHRVRIDADDANDLPASARRRHVHSAEDMAAFKIEVLTSVSEELCHMKSTDGDLLTVHYVGRTDEGVEFQNTYKSKEPVSFQLGAGHILDGIEHGVVGMCEGEKRRLYVPPSLAYGDDAIDLVPRGSSLIVDVELVQITHAGSYGHDLVFGSIDRNGDGDLSVDELRMYFARRAQDDPELVDLLVEEVIEFDDIDGDGVISWAEWSEGSIGADDFEEEAYGGDGDNSMF